MEQINKSKYHDNLINYAKDAKENNYAYPKRYCYVLTNLCNLACTFCFQDRKKQEGAMTAKDWIKLTNELPPNSRVTLTGGEPVVLKDFRKVFDYVASKFECNMITNGILLTENLIDFMLGYKNFKVLSISIDNRKNLIRKSANVKEKKWDEKWEHVESMMFYFQKRKKELNRADCVLDSKTVVLDENASDLLDIHKYCVDDLQCDTHAFQFLKGSPIQHSDIMFDLKKIYEPSNAQVYKNWEIIVDQLNKTKVYNSKSKKTAYLHPAVASIIDDSKNLEIDYLNNEKHDKNLYKHCSAPWGTVHINVDGTLFPCLAIDMGNVKKGLEKVIYGKKFVEFKEIIRKHGTVEACNRCGWLQPLK
jgi:MoaA/NifB/PqqE/SkfB family radical SAM enzyme